MAKFLFVLQADADVQIAVSTDCASIQDAQVEADKLLDAMVQGENATRRAGCICCVKVTDPGHHVVYLATRQCGTSGATCEGEDQASIETPPVAPSKRACCCPGAVENSCRPG